MGKLLRAGPWIALIPLLLTLACRAPLRLPDPTLPRVVAFELGPEVQDAMGLRQDLESAFHRRWKVVSQRSELPMGGARLTVQISRYWGRAAPGAGKGKFALGSVVLGGGGLALSGASGYSLLAWIPVAGVGVPLFTTGLVQMAKEASAEARRGYPLPEFRVGLHLVVRGGQAGGIKSLCQYDLRDHAPPLDAGDAKEEARIRHAMARALEGWVAEACGLSALVAESEP